MFYSKYFCFTVIIFKGGTQIAIRNIFDMKDNLKNSIQNDAVLGLVSLGYKKNEATQFVEKVDPNINSSQEIIRQVLKNVLSKEKN